MYTCQQQQSLGHQAHQSAEECQLQWLHLLFMREQLLRPQYMASCCLSLSWLHMQAPDTMDGMGDIGSMGDMPMGDMASGDDAAAMSPGVSLTRRSLTSYKPSSG